MAIELKRPTLVWTVLFCIVLVNGLMAVSSVGHAEHHAGHQAPTHSAGICAWLCAAGDHIEFFVIPFTSSLQLVGYANPVASPSVFTPGRFSHFFRGPPAARS